ncbi:ankyrin repeat domain-containing protein [Gemmatimonas sp.]|uniref:ankyrin repeat domain-containing protein n=1 Tax=Gemmatimonas sp. TaxID=1962908 RepID=UPI00286A505B|nr:ankyrin repeat domain-containing protein [Gemmatimonas sp.]
MPIEASPSASPSALAAAFFIALREDQHERAKALLDAHPALATFSAHTAAAVGNVEALRAFLAADHGAATTPTQPDGIEPIIFAATGQLKTMLGVSDSALADVVRVLLDAGAGANAFVEMPHDPRARISALYFACVSNNVPAARLLLERGADPNDGESVFHAAEHDHRDCLDLLLAHGANLSDAHAEWGNTPLYFLSAYSEPHARIDIVTRGMRWLLEHGADPNVPSLVTSRDQATGEQRPGVGEMPLHRLAVGRSVSAVRLFIEHGAVIDAPRADGRTPYALAVRTGNTEVADFLAASGADTARLDDVDRLLGACAVANEGEVRALVGANPDLIARLALADRQALHAAVDRNREASAGLMLRLGWPVTDEGEWGGTALHWAAWHGRPALVRLLLDHRAPVNVRDREYGSSPIAWASHGSMHSREGTDADYIAITNMLLEAGATRAESFNRWDESPESMASPGVAYVLQRRGFTSEAAPGLPEPGLPAPAAGAA